MCGCDCGWPYLGMSHLDHNNGVFKLPSPRLGLSGELHGKSRDLVTSLGSSDPDDDRSDTLVSAAVNFHVSPLLHLLLFR